MEAGQGQGNRSRRACLALAGPGLDSAGAPRSRRPNFGGRPRLVSGALHPIPGGIMPVDAPKRCPGYGGFPCPHRRKIPSELPRCAECKRLWQRLKDRAQNQRRPTYRNPEQVKRRHDAVKAHVQLFGWICFGDEYHPAHRTRDLTADHVPSVAEQVAAGIPVAVAEAGPLKVMCRRRNSQRK